MAVRCDVCGADFESRNKLFKHVRERACLNSATTAPVELPRQTIQPMLVGTGAVLYVTGGRHRGRTLTSCERYNPDDNTWTRCSSLKDGRGSHGAVSVNGLLYVIGGGGFESNLASCEVFNGFDWRSIAPSPTIRHALAVVDMENKIYALGGWMDGSLCSHALESYDPELNQWSVLAPMKTARRLLGATCLDQCIFAFGGNCDDPNWFTNKAEVYDTRTNTWRDLSDVPASGEMSAVTVNDCIYVLVHGNYVYRYNHVTNEFVKLSPLPLPEWFCFDTAVLGDSIIVYGGASLGKWSSQVYRYDVISGLWEELAPMSTCRRRCAGALVLPAQPPHSSSL